MAIYPIKKMNKSNNQMVSVIIPTYNRANLLPRSIESVLNQTYKNIELIIVDDKSTDNSLSIIKKYLKKDGRVKLIQHNKNYGGSIARNTGIKNSKGKYIAFQDSDDEWLPNKLELQIQELLENKKIDVVSCGVIYHNQDSKIVGQFIPSKKGNNLFEKMIVKEIVPGTQSVLIKKSCLEKVGGFDVTPANQDYILYIKLAKEKYFFSFIDKPLVNVYLQKKSITSNLEGRITGRFNIINKIKKYKLDEELSNISISSHLFRIGIYYLLKEDRKNTLKSFKESFYLNKNLKKGIFYFSTLFLPINYFKKSYLVIKKIIGDFIYF